jgi:mono/diheme cytochrome c family protein
VRAARVTAALAVLCAAAACAGAPVTPGRPPVTTYEEARGERLFIANCDRCHPQGHRLVGPSLLTPYHSATVIRAQVRQGVGGIMPAFTQRRISEPELDAIIAYVHFLEAHHPTKRR